MPLAMNEIPGEARVVSKETAESYTGLNQNLPEDGMWRVAKSEILRRTVFSAIQWREYPGSFSIYKSFRTLEFADLAMVKAYQTEKLRKLLRHAYEKVPYFRALFDTHGFQPKKANLPADFSRLPVMTKSVLMAERSALLSVDASPATLMANASGGSTGKPVEFYQDARYWETSRASRRMILGWWGVSPGEPMASIWGADRDIPEWTWRESLYYKICQTRVCNAFAMTEERMAKFASEMTEWQPRFVNGYASALELFGKFLIANPQFKIRPVAVESSAESLRDDQRKTIEAAFDAPLYNFYGSREVNNIAAECPSHSGLHTNMLTRYIEIVDNEGKPVPAGVPGRILVTDLSNLVMPFIRYENEDIGSWAAISCPCGRPFQLLERVWGRSSDFITTRSGKLIHGEYFTHLFYHIPEVSLFQVVQESPTSVRVSIVLRPGNREFPIAKIHEKMKEALGPGVDCCVATTDSIPVPASGKHRFTISKVKPNWSAAASELQ
jgi:phenylacetate-CoA ligase